MAITQYIKVCRNKNQNHVFRWTVNTETRIFQRELRFQSLYLIIYSVLVFKLSSSTILVFKLIDHRLTVLVSVIKYDVGIDGDNIKGKKNPPFFPLELNELPSFLFKLQGLLEIELGKKPPFFRAPIFYQHTR